MHLNTESEYAYCNLCGNREPCNCRSLGGNLPRAARFNSPEAGC